MKVFKKGQNRRRGICSLTNKFNVDSPWRQMRDTWNIYFLFNEKKKHEIIQPQLKAKTLRIIMRIFLLLSGYYWAIKLINYDMIWNEPYKEAKKKTQQRLKFKYQTSKDLLAVSVVHSENTFHDFFYCHFYETFLWSEN